VTSVTWLGHSTTLIDTGGQRFLTDPVLRAGIGPIRRRAHAAGFDVSGVDAVLLSHLHHDHFDTASLQTLPPDTLVVVPRGAARLTRRFRRVEEVAERDTVQIGGVRVSAVHADHSGRRLPFGPSAPALGFVIDGHERVYFAGDTALYPGMASVGSDLDVALLPVGGWGPTLGRGHMDPAQAAAALRLLSPRFAIPVHWGTLWPLGLSRFRRERFERPARRFLDDARVSAPEVSVVVLEPGGSFVVPRAE
jgi:L-ascorbate metabolism protein UlaG (beta-lactamase superfamily)